jgi:hypothetical protein
MKTLLLRFVAAAAVIVLLPVVALAAVTGLVIKDNGSVVASVVDGTVTGEISVPPGQISNDLEVFWLDDNHEEFQPAAPPGGMTAHIVDPAVADFTSTGTWTFTITAHDPGHTEISFSLTDNGSPVFTSEPIELHSEEAHVEADGFVLRQGGVDILKEWRGTVTGEVVAYQGQTSALIQVIFLSPDSLEFTPDEPEFELRLDIADSSIVQWRSVDQWTFRVHGGAIGSTTFTLNVFHVDHDDFVSPSLPAETRSAVAVDPVGIADGLHLATPFPNPVRSAATLRYVLQRSQSAELAVFDLSGRRVAQLSSGVQAAGSHSIIWHTESVKPGVYLARLRTADGVRVRRFAVTG